jgi:outer membrane protein assembly factor BamD
MRMLKQSIHTFVLLVAVMVTVSSCRSDFKKLQKSTDLNQKYEAALKYYEKGDNLKAQILLEELIPLYRGQGRAEDILYYYAKATFDMGDYTLAQYHFKNFVRTYPNSLRAEECSYMNAYCFYLNSPGYSLDQTDTYRAIQEFQLFINEYPNSTRVEEANQKIDQLREKLEMKAYENAKLYFKTGDYKAAIVAFNLVLKDFSNTKHKEEVNFLVLRSNYLLAVNSIDAKKSERIDATIDNYYKFIALYPQSQYLKDAEQVYNDALHLKEKFKTKS